MKKLQMILLAVLLLCGMSTLSYAKSKLGKSSHEYIQGTIVSINADKNEIVLKDDKTGSEKTIAVSASTLSSLKLQEQVKVTLKAGTTTATSVKKVSTAKKSGK